MKLTLVPGIGEKLATQLVTYFGSEEAALRALLDAELGPVAEAVGSERRALRIIRAARLAAAGCSGDASATNDARMIATSSISYVASFTSSRPGGAWIATLAPHPSGCAEAASERLQRLLGLAARAQAASPGERKRARSVLEQLDWLRPCRAQASVTLIIELEEARAARRDLEKLKKLIPGLKVETVTDLERRMAEGYTEDTVFYDPHGVLVEAPVARKLTLEEVAPRIILECAAQRSGPARLLLELARAAPSLLHSLYPSEAEKLLPKTRRLVDTVNAYLEGRLGEPYERLKKILDNLDAVVTDIEVWINEEAKKRLERLELRLTAAELLRMIDEIALGTVPVPPPVAGLFEELALEAENRLAEQLGLTAEEAAALAGVVEPSPRLPLQLDRSKIEALRQVLTRRAAAAAHEAMKPLARIALEAMESTEKAYRILKTIDVVLALAEYAAKTGGAATELTHSYLGVGIVNGQELDLLRSRVPVQPVSYVVGCTPYKPEGTSCENIVLLTGANSGGKTTLLKLLAETATLAQAGLPAPAEKAWVGGFDEIHFISKPTGMLSAGALETLLKKLASVVEEPHKRRLVLIDELEAVTEASAAAKILSVFIEELSRSKNTVAVIVTHMAEQVLQSLSPEAAKTVRIDGIEARGLDENYNLIVDRTPRYRYLARSTPELVVTKLLKTTRNSRERRFYEKLLSRMK